MMQEDACLDNSKPFVQVLVAQVWNQTLQKNQNLKYKSSMNSKKKAESKIQKRMYDQCLNAYLATCLSYFWLK